MIEYDPYEGNILIDGLGPIPSSDDIEKSLLYLPKRPKEVLSAPLHVRLHELLLLEHLYAPSHTSVEVALSIDMALRHSYRSRDPRIPRNRWKEHPSGRLQASIQPHLVDASFPPESEDRARVITGRGVAGLGKTATIRRGLGRYPELIVHKSFPGIIGPHLQIVRLSINIPPSGQLVDLAAALMSEWDRILVQRFGPNAATFEAPLLKYRSNRKPSQGIPMFEEWSARARAHFLGALHLDEVQNFFRLATKESRRAARSLDVTPELTIKEDEALLRLLTWCNTMSILLIISGTPDGIDALGKRLSVLQRIANGSFHDFAPLDGPDGPIFKFLTNRLADYQYVKSPLKITDDARKALYRLSGGVHRILVALWVAGQRVALRRESDDFRIDDLEKAASTLLAPLKPAVQAMQSGDPLALRRYQDLMQANDVLWKTFWA